MVVVRMGGRGEAPSEVGHRGGQEVDPVVVPQEEKTVAEKMVPAELATVVSAVAAWEALQGVVKEEAREVAREVNKEAVREVEQWVVAS